MRTRGQLLVSAAWILFVMAGPAGAGIAPNGSKFLVSTYTSTGYIYDQFLPRVAMDGGGRFVVVWASPSGGEYSTKVEARRYTPSGRPVGEEFRVNSMTDGMHIDPAVAADGSGRFVVVWSDYQGGCSGSSL